MVCHGNRGRQAGKRKIGKSGTLSPELVDRTLCRKIPAEGTKTRSSYVIYRTDDLNCSGSDTERPRCFWIQMIPPRNGITAVNTESITVKKNDYKPNDWWYVSKVSVNVASTF